MFYSSEGTIVGEVAVVWSKLQMEKDKMPRIVVTQEDNRRGREDDRERHGERKVGSKIVCPGLDCCARLRSLETTPYRRSKTNCEEAGNKQKKKIN